MNFIKQIEQLQMLNKLIKQECTGAPSELAKRLCVSRSKLYELIETIKCWGLDVKYNRSRQTFFFIQEEELDIQFSLKIIKSGESRKIYGGQLFYSVLFSGRSDITLDLKLIG